MADYHVATGTYAAWNNGWAYRANLLNTDGKVAVMVMNNSNDKQSFNL